MMDNDKKGKGDRDRECRMYLLDVACLQRSTELPGDWFLLAVSKSCTGQSKFTVGQYKESNFMNTSTRDKESNFH